MTEEGLVFGKKRHFFGGIEPSNMKVFSVVHEVGSKPRITATLPDDTIIEEQTLCTVAGAIIRRGTFGYPKDEFDGVLVSNLTSSATFTDETADVNGTYYYAAFPYTTQGVYNRNPINRDVFNEPSPMRAFSSELSYDISAQQSVVELTVTLPDSVVGAVIRKSSEDYPANETDGNEFQNLTESGMITDKDVEEGVTYYYSAFPYTSTGLYNRDASNRTSCVVLPAERPDNMKAFSVVCDEVEQVKITATLPDPKDEEVGGAYIVRKTDGYPTNESDGELVTDLKSSGTYTDTGLTGDVIYYYAAFPYSVRGIINRNHVSENQASCKVLAPVEPGDMKGFSTGANDIGRVVLTATLPDNKLEGGVTVCTVAGVMIRRSLTEYPLSETDGTLVADLKQSGTAIDTDIVGNQVYYYTAFPYSDKGLFNRNPVPANRATATGKSYGWYYGYDITLEDENPDTRVSYPEDVENTSFTPAKMNFDTDTFDYGSWNFAPGEKFMPRPCMLTLSGTVEYYLNPNDYTKKENGDDSNFQDYSNSKYTGNAMMEWGKIYTKRWEEDGIYHFRASDTKLDSEYECWTNYDINDKEIDHFYTAICEGSTSSINSKTCLRSIAGVTSANVIDSDDWHGAVTKALNLGEDWFISVLADHQLITDLLVLITRTTNLQNVCGNGVTNYSSGEYNPGQKYNKGLFWGSSIYRDIVKVFGMENYWGNRKEWLAGLAINTDGKYMVKMTRGRKDGGTATNYGYIAGSGLDRKAGYITLDGISITNNLDGYITKCYTHKFGRFPCEATKGSATTYECDNMKITLPTGNDPKCAFIGGSVTTSTTTTGTANRPKPGPFYLDMTNISTANSSGTTARLSCKPRK